MKVTQIFYFVVIAITSGYGQSQIPQIINTSGGSSQKSYSIQWSIGELALVNEMDAMDGSYIFTNGFIQPTDGLAQPSQQKLTQPVSQNSPSFNNIELGSANIRVFPNPTQDILEIDFFQSVAGKINLQLSNGLGHILYTRKVSAYGLGLIEKINMKGFTNGIYILDIKGLNPVSGQYDLKIGSYKIIKL